MTLRDDEILEVFRELPGHRGSSAAELDATEKLLGIKFPVQYREFMELDSNRLCIAEIAAPLSHLAKLHVCATELLERDGFEFRLQADDVVFAWDEIYAFLFFKADGSNDPATWMFNYNDSESDGKPVVISESLTGYFTDRLRQYLNLSWH
ncbi:SMI1/KNR4 family protein [Stieleria sp. JC731]|uniref:SMI1/KNR4 family protein n=1 Tax=Stieleria sp. JC731 TaxID=2894195 RepID=UPI001E5022F6|nr:SMI1/KNR4 family protein [Stieleria sp. JC731]MCC9603338.1 SMI1/KNR4 family protein [Stieleria sp. JC731]